MSTQMGEEDWTHTLEVFRACLPRRGRKASDDRRFLEAMHFLTVENFPSHAETSASMRGSGFPLLFLTIPLRRSNNATGD